MATGLLKYTLPWRLSKMKTANTIEQEVNQIRLQIYEKTKDMTAAQLTAYYQKSGEASARKYGFKIVARANQKTSCRH